MHDNTKPISESDFELDRPMSRMICIFHALSHPVRLTICKHLLARPHSVTEISWLKQYAVSQQLAVLRNSDVVTSDRVSRNVIYSLRSDAVRRILRVSLRNTELEEVAVPGTGHYARADLLKSHDAVPLLSANLASVRCQSAKADLLSEIHTGRLQPARQHNKPFSRRSDASGTGFRYV